MAFTLYRVEADYVISRSDVVGPGWVCQTAWQAQDLVDELRASRKDLCRFVIKACRYGY